jgi:hypothetical protein
MMQMRPAIARRVAANVLNGLSAIRASDIEQQSISIDGYAF